MKKWAVFLSVVLGVLFAWPVVAQGWSVVLWYGTPEELPDTWQVCDGTNGTPDMRDQFIVGAGSTYTLGETGGTITMTVAITPATTVVESWVPAQPVTVVESLTYTADMDNRPPYLAAYYVCYSGTLAMTSAITDPVTTDYYTTTEGIVYSKVRTVTTEGEITNYLLGALVVIAIIYLLGWAIMEGKRRWS